MYNSKRFLAFCIAIALFTAMVFFTPYAPMELAGAITMICGVYIGAQTYRSSQKE